MSTVQETPPETTKTAAEQELANEANQDATGIVAEFWQFVTESGKWWLIPVLVSLLAVAAFVVLGSSGLSPFLYSLF